MAKSKVKFLEAVEVLDHNGDIEFEAKAGDVVSLDEASASRWIRRGKATTNTKKEKVEKPIEVKTTDKESNKPDALKSVK